MQQIINLIVHQIALQTGMGTQEVLDEVFA